VSFSHSHPDLLKRVVLNLVRRGGHRGECRDGPQALPGRTASS